MRATKWTLVLGIIILAISDAAVGADKKPPVITSVFPGAEPPKMAAPVRAILDKLDGAYSNAKTMEMTITYTQESIPDKPGKIAPSKNSCEIQFAFTAPNQFRYDFAATLRDGDPNAAPLKPPHTLVCTGKAVYDYMESVMKTAMMAPAPAGRYEAISGNALGPINSLSNAVAFPLFQKSSDKLGQFHNEIRKAADVKIDAGSFNALELIDGGKVVGTVLIDPKTYLVRRVTLVSKSAGIMTTTNTYDFTSSKVDGEIDADRFNWTPPPGVKISKLPGT